MYDNYCYITIVIIQEEGSVRAAKNTNYKRHDRSCSH